MREAVTEGAREDNGQSLRRELLLTGRPRLSTGAQRDHSFSGLFGTRSVEPVGCERRGDTMQDSYPLSRAVFFDVRG